MHKPNIDPISERIAKGRVSEMKGRNVWEHLYNLDKEFTEKRDQCHLEQKLREEKEHLKDCTFQPELIRTNNGEENTKSEIYNRTQQWKQNVDEK